MNAKDIQKCNNYEQVITSLKKLKEDLDDQISNLKGNNYRYCKNNNIIGNAIDDALSELYATISFDNCLIPYDLLVVIKDLVDYSERTLRKRFENANSPQELKYNIAPINFAANGINFNR